MGARSATALKMPDLASNGMLAVKIRTRQLLKPLTHLVHITLLIFLVLFFLPDIFSCFVFGTAPAECLVLSCRSCLQGGCSASQRPDRAWHCPEGNPVSKTKGSCKGRHPVDGQLAHWIAHWETKGSWHPIALVKCWQAPGIKPERWHACQ